MSEQPRFYGADASRFARELALPKVVQQGILADTALTLEIRAERRQNNPRRQWLELTGYLLEKDDRYVDRT